MQIAVLGIDLGKNRCSVAGLDATGRVILRRRMHRDSVVKLAAELSGTRDSPSWPGPCPETGYVGADGSCQLS